MTTHLGQAYGAAAEAMLAAAAEAAGITLRLEAHGDRALADQIYISTRLEEVASTGWPVAEQEKFLAMQAMAQYRHYDLHYRPVSDFWLLEQADQVIGRLYLCPGAEDLRIVDIVLLPAWRARGFGGALIAAVTSIAAAAGRTASIHVEHNNPARNLYLRLGFVPVEEVGPYHLMVFTPPALAAAS